MCCWRNHIYEHQSETARLLDLLRLCRVSFSSMEYIATRRAVERIRAKMTGKSSGCTVGEVNKTVELNMSETQIRNFQFF